MKLFLLLLLLTVSCTVVKINVKKKYKIIAHKGYHNSYKPEIFFTSNNKYCAQRERKNLGADFDFSIENLKQAFNLGADIVEVDTRLTKDGIIIVTHDERLECLSNMTGKISDYTYEELNRKFAPNHKVYFIEKGKKVFPFKYKGVGQLLSLDFLVSSFPDKKFLINPKDRSQSSFEFYLKFFKKHSQRSFILWGPEKLFKQITLINQNVSEFISNHFQSRKCLDQYRSGGALNLCQNLSLSLSLRDTKALNGWPHSFLNQMHNVGVKVYIFLPSIDEENKIQEALDSNIEGVIVSDIKGFIKKFTN